jgi:hypothetical protein
LTVGTLLLEVGRRFFSRTERAGRHDVPPPGIGNGSRNREAARGVPERAAPD